MKTTKLTHAEIKATSVKAAKILRSEEDGFFKDAAGAVLNLMLETQKQKPSAGAEVMAVKAKKFMALLAS